jgi:hypothetical protein
MAFGDSAVLLDDFNRSNEGPPPSANWSDLSDGQMEVISNACQPGSAGSGADLNAAYWSAAQFGPNMEAHYLWPTQQTQGDWCFVYGRLTVTSQTDFDGYSASFIKRSGTDRWEIYEQTAGSNTQLGASVDEESADNEGMGIWIDGSTIYNYRWNGSSWEEQLNRTDTTNAGAGYTGILVRDNNMVADNFYAGTVGAGGSLIVPANYRQIRSLLAQ